MQEAACNFLEEFVLIQGPVQVAEAKVIPHLDAEHVAHLHAGGNPPVNVEGAAGFDKAELERAIEVYNHRERRYGGLV